MTRHRSVVLASAPSLCLVCGGKRVVRLVALLGIPAIGSVPCPHCQLVEHCRGGQTVLIPDLPYLHEQPRST